MVLSMVGLLDLMELSPLAVSSGLQTLRLASLAGSSAQMWMCRSRPAQETPQRLHKRSMVRQEAASRAVHKVAGDL